jgi:holo-[acyl-carrier protein] synthase
VEVPRIAKSISAYGDRFTHRVFTAGERAYASSKANAAERYAARFAAKEATMKAMGTGLADGIGWTQIEVANDDSGKPSLHLHGTARAKADSMGVRRIWLTLSHSSQNASAVVIFED